MCPELQEDVVFGRYIYPRASPENLAAFQKAQGYEKCALLPGAGARLAAEVMLAGDGPARSWIRLGIDLAHVI